MRSRVIWSETGGPRFAGSGQVRPIFEFDEAEKALLREGLTVIDLPGAGVLRAREVVRSLPHLSIHDGFAFALAEANPGCILLTGDGPLRDLGENQGMEVHGVLWVIDQIHSDALTPAAALLGVLRMFASHPTVRLPRRTLAAYIRRYEKLR